MLRAFDRATLRIGIRNGLITLRDITFWRTGTYRCGAVWKGLSKSSVELV